MTDIRMIAERWGVWARSGISNMGWYSRTAATEKLTPTRSRCRPSLTDEAGLEVSACMVKLNKQSPASHDLIYDYHLLGLTLSKIAANMACSIPCASKRLQKAEEMLYELLMLSDCQII